MTGTKFPCRVSSKPVASNHNALCCDSCDKSVHIKCNFLNKKLIKNSKMTSLHGFVLIVLRINCLFNHR